MRNKRRVVPLLMILSLAVALMVVVQSLVASARDTAYALYGSYQGIEVVAPRVKSSQDAYKPLAQTLDTLRASRGTLEAGGNADGAGGLGQLAEVLQKLQGVGEELKGLPAVLEASKPSTAPLQASLAGASQHGQALQGDLTRLSADLRRAQQQESEQQKLATLLADAQRDPSNIPALMTYLQQPHNFAALTQPDTTDYEAIAMEADRAGADAGALSTDLATVQAQVTALDATAPPALPDITKGLPSLDAALPKLPAASEALKGLSTQLDTLESQLVAAGGPAGNVDEIEAAVKTIPGVARVERDTYSSLDLNMLAGDAGFDLYGMSQEGMGRMMDHYGVSLAEGRLPRPDQPEVAIAEEVALARGLAIGGQVGSDVNELDSLPEHFTIVGLLRGPTRLGFVPREYMMANYFFARRYQALVVIPEPGRLLDTRAPLHKLIEGQNYRIFDGPFVADKIDSLLVNLQRINDFMTLAVGLTLALVIGLLNNLYFRQRMNEFGLLAALGYPRRRLAGKVAVEGGVVVAVAWVLGAAIGAAALAWFNTAYMVPHGLVLRVFDPGILLRATLPVPVMVLIVSLGTLLWQLWRLDPIAIIERRD
jgi:hypothetical protein